MSVNIDDNILDNFKYISLRDLKKFKKMAILSEEGFFQCRIVDCNNCIFSNENMSNKANRNFEYACGSYGALIPFNFSNTPKKVVIDYVSMLEKLLIKRAKINKLNI